MRRVVLWGSFCAKRCAVVTLVRNAHVEGKVEKQKILHPRLYQLSLKEEKEESVRDFLPAQPAIPHGWNLKHVSGSNQFNLTKKVEIRGCGEETLHVIACMEQKQYEGTYRMDNGEREEQEYLNFTLFINKTRSPHLSLEFGLTSIDMELVMDSLAIHNSNETCNNARRCLQLKSGTKYRSLTSSTFAKNNQYRGPMLSELDEELSDEILDYLDERGVNNAFAEYMMSQAYFFEQQEYLHWLKLLRRFAA